MIHLSVKVGDPIPSWLRPSAVTPNWVQYHIVNQSIYRNAATWLIEHDVEVWRHK